MKFTITQDDIDKGFKKSPSDCAAARAIRRAMPEVQSVTVSPNKVFVDRDIYPTPKELQEFINRYDDALSVEPMEFTLA